MSTTQHFHRSTRRFWACAAITLVAVVTVAVWAANMGGDRSRIAAMLGAAIAVTAATVGGRTCRPAFLQREQSQPRR